MEVHLLALCFNDAATTEVHALSLHGALPICEEVAQREGDGLPAGDVDAEGGRSGLVQADGIEVDPDPGALQALRSEEHTSELQSRLHLVCRLLLEKKKTKGHIDVIA